MYFAKNLWDASSCDYSRIKKLKIVSRYEAKLFFYGNGGKGFYVSQRKNLRQMRQKMDRNIAIKFFSSYQPPAKHIFSFSGLKTLSFEREKFFWKAPFNSADKLQPHTSSI